MTRSKSSLSTEYFNLKKDLAAAVEERDKYAAIARAVNLVARRRVLADRFLPEAPRTARERVRFVTHPQALAEVLERLVAVADEVDGVLEVENEELTDLRARVADLEDERDQLLERCGIDLYAWDREKRVR